MYNIHVLVLRTIKSTCFFHIIYYVWKETPICCAIAVRGDGFGDDCQGPMLSFPEDKNYIIIFLQYVVFKTKERKLTVHHTIMDVLTYSKY